MASYRSFNFKHHHSHQYKYPKYVPRNHRYRYEDENYKSRRIHRQHYYRSNNDARGKYDYNIVQTNRAPSPVHWKPTQRQASPPTFPPTFPPIAVPIIEKPIGSNWKLIADPFFGQVPNKIYRFDGIVPNDSSYPEVIVKDPRTFQYKNKVTNLPICLPVPIYKIDNHSTGQRPEVEVTFSNLDDHIDSAFLSNLVVKYGKVELVQIYYHPVSKEHLNLAKIIFDEPVAAKFCVQSLNKTSIMGKVVNVFLDPFATQCKKMYNNMIKKSKPVPEVHKIKLISVSNINKQCFKSAKSNEEPIVKPQTKEKSYPPTIKNCTNYNCDHATILSSIQSDNSLGGNLGYSETHPYTYDRYSCNIPVVPDNYWEVTSPVDSLPLIPEPPIEPNIDSAQSKLNLNSKTEVLLSEKDSSVKPVFLSIVKEEPDDTLDCKDNIIDDNLNLNMSIQPLVNDDQSDLTVKEITNDEEMLHLISNSKSPFSYKDIYFKCVNATIKRENEKLEAENLLNIISNTKHESPDRDISFRDEHLLGKSPRRNIPDGAMSLPSHDEEIIENDTIIPQCTKLTNNPPYEYYPPQFNNHCYQYFPFSLSHPCGPPLVTANYCDSKPSYDRCENENFPVELRKKLMAALVNELKNIIKSDLMKKVRTTLAFKMFDKWWEKAERQLKSTSVTNEECKSEQPAPNLNSTLEGKTEDSETLTGFGLGIRATVPKMQFFHSKKKESSPKKTSKQLNKGSDREEMVSSSENETKSIDDDEMTRFTFAEQKREGKELFYSDSSTSTSDSSHNSSDVEGSSSDSSKNEDSRDEFKWKNKFVKLYKSMTLENLNKIKDLTPARNDGEGSYIKNKCDGKTMKRKIDDNLRNPVESKKRSVNREKTSIEENSSSEFANRLYCLSQQVSYKETKVDATNKYFKSQPIVNKQKIPNLLTTKLKQPLASRDSNKIENINQLNLQKQSGSEVKTKYFNRRDMVKEASVLCEFLTKGIDVEDINYLKQSYDSLSNGNVHHRWLNETHWISHPDIPNEIPDKKKKDEWKIHDTGCARTEGYYKVDSKQKTNFKYHFGCTSVQINLTKEFKRIKESTGNMLALSREARSQQRGLLTAFGTTSYSDLLKFKVLKFRKKRLSFGKSVIHDWGLFAMENIAADEMVIEYVGQIIRPIVADLRERQYEASGIGSSYLFRIDLDTIVDATKCGNLSRFINHSCNPNCYAKVVQIEGQKKIVIYSKQPIFVNEEITYDYKFPLEENKIPCLCGENGCRGTLN